MFSGLIAHLGTIASCTDAHGGLRLRVTAPTAISEGVAAGDSIAVDGVCLTVAACGGDAIDFEVVPETLARSTLGELGLGATVNVELSLRLGERLGGHLVYGHVDATARVLAKPREGQGHRLKIETPRRLHPAIVEKGYVAVDGVSLTVAAAGEEHFEIALIPETSVRTSLGNKGPGDRVNLELDPIARYAVAAAAHVLAREQSRSSGGQTLEARLPNGGREP